MRPRPSIRIATTLAAATALLLTSAPGDSQPLGRDHSRRPARSESLLFAGTPSSYKRSAFPRDVPLPFAAEDTVVSVVDAGATAWFHMEATPATLWSFYDDWARRDGFIAVDPVDELPFRMWRKEKKVVRVDVLPAFQDGDLEVFLQVFAAPEEKTP